METNHLNTCLYECLLSMSYKVKVLVGAFSEYCTTFDIVKHHQTLLTCALLFTCLWSWTIGSHFHCGLSVIKTSIHTIHTILPIHIKNVLRAGSVGRPLWVSALAGGLQAAGAQKVSCGFHGIVSCFCCTFWLQHCQIANWTIAKCCTSFENHVFPPQKHPPLFIYCLFCAIICINWSTS